MNANWKKSMIVAALVLFGSTAFSFACGETDKREVRLSDIQGRVWKLIEVKNESATITISRTNAPTDIYTIKFETNRLIGSGAYNRFFSHYTIGEDPDIAIWRIANSTRVEPYFEMEDFKEYEYFKCLENVNHWYIHNGNLELHTYLENDTRIILIFS
jgi:heat shock protein HslJ